MNPLSLCAFLSCVSMTLYALDASLSVQINELMCHVNMIASGRPLSPPQQQSFIAQTHRTSAACVSSLAGYQAVADHIGLQLGACGYQPRDLAALALQQYGLPPGEQEACAFMVVCMKMCSDFFLSSPGPLPAQIDECAQLVVLQWQKLASSLRSCVVIKKDTPIPDKDTLFKKRYLLALLFLLLLLGGNFAFSLYNREKTKHREQQLDSKIDHAHNTLNTFTKQYEKDTDTNRLR